MPLHILNGLRRDPTLPQSIKTLTVIVALLLLPGTTAVAQKSNVAANQSWPGFWRRITVAINKKDHAALLRIMPKDFFDGGGGLTPQEWLRYLDENEQHGSWKDLQRSFAMGTKIHREWSAQGKPTRVTKDNGYYFEFRKDRKWYFAGVVGD